MVWRWAEVTKKRTEKGKNARTATHHTGARLSEARECDATCRRSDERVQDNRQKTVPMERGEEREKVRDG